MATGVDRKPQWSERGPTRAEQVERLGVDLSFTPQGLQARATIFLNARDGKNGSRDENACCDDVVRPLIHLAIELSGNGKWWFQNV
jgi:hypothetical protein